MPCSKTDGDVDAGSKQLDMQHSYRLKNSPLVATGGVDGGRTLKQCGPRGGRTGELGVSK
jgi:hypothetical protein